MQRLKRSVAHVDLLGDATGSLHFSDFLRDAARHFDRFDLFLGRSSRQIVGIHEFRCLGAILIKVIVVIVVVISDSHAFLGLIIVITITVIIIIIVVDWNNDRATIGSLHDKLTQHLRLERVGVGTLALAGESRGDLGVRLVGIGTEFSRNFGRQRVLRRLAVLRATRRHALAASRNLDILSLAQLSCSCGFFSFACQIVLMSLTTVCFGVSE